VNAKGLAKIGGVFNVTRDLVLHTERGSITGHLQVDQLDIGSFEIPRVRLTSGRGCALEFYLCSLLTLTYISLNSDILIKSKLISSTSSRGGIFDIRAQSSLGDVSLELDVPIDSHVNAEVSTTVGSAHVSLPPAYVGSFQLNAFLPFRKLQDGRLELGDEYPKDPTGAGRDRVLWVDYEGLFRYDGAVVWFRGGQGNGMVKATSRFGFVSLAF